ncbi:MAG: hypothetical protein MJZ81_07675 [Bacteroidales bacterium]|nr:hypothetical protein [Bacteroidales bacterium]
MKQMNKGLYKVTTERVVGFTNAVERLGKHEVCGSMVYYRPEHVRMVLQGKQKSVKLLLLIAQKVPEMFEVCKTCDDVKAWYENFKKQEVA